MKIEVEEKNTDADTLAYWTCIHITSDDDLKRTTILVGTSRTYLPNLFHNKDVEVSPEQWRQWIKEIEIKWIGVGDEIFKQKVYYDPYAKNLEGKGNIRTLLKRLGTKIL